MAKLAILPRSPKDVEVDVFSNKSSLILFWLLVNHKRAKELGFSLNELSRITGLSLGLVHKVIQQLEYDGKVTSKGLRTNKKFYLKSADKILVDWIKKYNLIKKTKTKGFVHSHLNSSIDTEMYGLYPALHTAAADLFSARSTNLRVSEYYVLEWEKLERIVKQLHLEELNRGYELLLIKPYYSELLKKIKESTSFADDWNRAYAILNLLDLCHFPLRGIEQAEVVFKKNGLLNSILSWKEVENAVG